MMRTALCVVALLSVMVVGCSSRRATIVTSPGVAPRVLFGVDKLSAALKQAGYEVAVTQKPQGIQRKPSILVSTQAGQVGDEGFVLESKDGAAVVTGGDDSGALYGCLELAGRIRQAGAMPKDFRFADKPAMVLRGVCIGMQKTQLLPGRDTYEYPYTPENFPFFYDKAFWQEYLDLLAENRMNTLYLWNGHPFASLVKLDDYPYALEVSAEVYAKNVEMYNYLTREADKRGIWVIQMFYNIFVSKPFAERNGIETQLKAPTPLAADYNRKSIAAFVQKYPNVGLLVCLGEALTGTDNQVQWFTRTIIPGVQDGIKALGLSQEPPIIVRAHATDPNAVMHAALPLYTNLYTMAKYNGESLTTWEPRGPWQQVHLNMSRLGSQHVVNVHILANLEPFRYGAPRFIQKSVKAMQTRLGAQGMHLYPLCYWNWPFSPDNVEPKLKQWDRDWIWFEAWARYAWNPDRDEQQDRQYWIGRLTEKYGDAKAAANILDAYNDAGECAPRLIRRFGITEGNRQTLSLGMTLDQLVDPNRYNAFKDLWLSQAPPGERLQEYVEKEWNHAAHTGETPPQIAREAVDYSHKAVQEIELARPGVTKNRAEFERLCNDFRCIAAMSDSYAAKASAATLVLRYNYSKDPADLQKAAEHLAESLTQFRKLTDLTRGSYTFAQSMQTSQRKIPFSGAEQGKAANYHWTQVLPKYEQELTEFQKRVADAIAGKQP